MHHLTINQYLLSFSFPFPFPLFPSFPFLVSVHPNKKHARTPTVNSNLVGIFEFRADSALGGSSFTEAVAAAVADWCGVSVSQLSVAASGPQFIVTADSLDLADMTLARERLMAVVLSDNAFVADTSRADITLFRVAPSSLILGPSTDFLVNPSSMGGNRNNGKRREKKEDKEDGRNVLVVCRPTFSSPSFFPFLFFLFFLFLSFFVSGERAKKWFCGITFVFVAPLLQARQWRRRTRSPLPLLRVP